MAIQTLPRGYTPSYSSSTRKTRPTIQPLSSYTTTKTTRIPQNSDQLTIQLTNTLSTFEMMPPELLTKIFTYVTFPTARNSGRVEMPRSVNAMACKEDLSLYSCLQVSKTFYEIVFPLLHREPPINTRKQLLDFATQLKKAPQIGKHVRRLDLSHRFCVTYDRAESENRELLEALLEILKRTPLIRELELGSIYPTWNLSELQQIIFGDLAYLEKLHIDGFNESALCCPSLIEILKSRQTPSPISDLSLREIDHSILDDFTDILPYLHNLRRLTFCAAQFVTTQSIERISHNARLEHLDVYTLAGNALDPFLATHPAVVSTLKSLRIENFYPPGTNNVGRRVPFNLPKTLERLEIGDLQIDTHDISLLQPLSNLEYLQAGDRTRIADLERLVLGAQYTYAPSQLPTNLDQMTALLGSTTTDNDAWNTLAKTILVTKLGQRLSGIKPQRSGNPVSSLRYLNIWEMETHAQAQILDSVLLSEVARPLEVIEVSEEAMRHMSGAIGPVMKSAGWRVRNAGRRYWIERKNIEGR